MAGRDPLWKRLKSALAAPIRGETPSSRLVDAARPAPPSDEAAVSYGREEMAPPAAKAPSVPTENPMASAAPAMIRPAAVATPGKMAIKTAAAKPPPRKTGRITAPRVSRSPLARIRAVLRTILQLFGLIISGVKWLLISAMIAALFLVVVGFGFLLYLNLRDALDHSAALKSARPIAALALQERDRARDAKIKAEEAAAKGRARGLCASSGYVVCKYEDGSSIAGQEPYGYGVRRSSDGTVLSGFWPEDWPAGYGVIAYPDGTVWEGDWNRGGIDSCLGMKTFKDGAREVGLTHGEKQEPDCQPPPGVSFGPAFAGTQEKGADGDSPLFRFAGYVVDARRHLSLWVNDKTIEAKHKEVGDRP